MAHWMLRGIVVLVRGDYSPLSLMAEWWGAGMVICLEPYADLHMAQLMPLPITVSCFRLVLSFWYRIKGH